MPRKRVKFSTEVALRELDGAKQAEARERLLEIEGALEEFPNCSLRDDSRLAFQYATNTGDAAEMPFEDVVREIVSVQFLFNESCYNQLCQQDMKQVAAHYHERYPHVSWRQLWTIVRSHMIPCAKLEAADRVGGISF